MGRFLGILTAGLAAVLIVGAVAIYGLDNARKIEADLQRAADRKLDETGPPWASVEVRGRDAILTGEALLPSERRQAAEKAAPAIDAMPGIREVRDNTTARFRSMADIEAKLFDICKRAVAGLPAAWMKCSVKGQTVTLGGIALTHTARRTAVEKVFTAVESLNARETVRDTTRAHYQSSGEMRRILGAACESAVAGFTLNWLKCVVEGRNFTLSGAAPVEAERAARVATARASLEAVKGVAGIADRTTVLPALSSAQACRAAFDRLKRDTPIRFAPGTAAIAPESKALLDALTVAAKRCVGVRIEIRGHTDDTGDAERDRKLSAARSQAVAAHMTGLGVPPDRVSARGYGGTQPLVANDTEAGRAKNRRIEFAMSE
ncbi:MAG: OmpA family protein [Rhodospirillaceae bacterium]|nr:OmpA family protein [Rhodospirillaceae bacterium]